MKYFKITIASLIAIISSLIWILFVVGNKDGSVLEMILFITLLSIISILIIKSLVKTFESNLKFRREKEYFNGLKSALELIDKDLKLSVMDKDLIEGMEVVGNTTIYIEASDIIKREIELVRKGKEF